MTDIFISYSQKDRDRVSRIVDALTAEGYTVWWDLEIRAGESFDRLIENTLERVSCVVGVWSRNSVKSEWVRAESAWAKARGIFVSVRIDDDAALPLKFYHVHTASMAGWNGSRDAAAFRSLVRDVGSLAGPGKPATDTLSPKPEVVDGDTALAVTTPGPLPGFRDPLRGGGEGPQMVVIPAGGFWMGSPDGEAGRCGSEWDGEKTAPAGSFKPNTWRLHDMHGNVWEWTEDWWHGDYNGAPDDGRAWLEEDGGKRDRRVVRGGCWFYNPDYARSAFRDWNTPDVRDGNLGFRVVCSSPISDH
jgi:hypothetical protein